MDNENTQLDVVATSLLEDLTNNPIVDVELLKVKLKSYLTILLDEAIKNRRIKELHKQTQKHIKMTERLEIQVCFWKLMTKRSKADMSEMYSAIDKVLELYDSNSDLPPYSQTFKEWIDGIKKIK